MKKEAIRKGSSSILIVFLMVSIGALFIPQIEAQSWTDITLPYLISASGNYRVTSDYSGTAIGIDIDADDVVIDGNGHTIETSDYHINLWQNPDASDNVEIYNITLTGSGNGIAISGSIGAVIHDCTISTSAYNGILGVSHGGAQIYNNTFAGGAMNYGLNLEYGDGDEVFENDFVSSSAEAGMLLLGETNAQIYNNTFTEEILGLKGYGNALNVTMMDNDFLDCNLGAFLYGGGVSNYNITANIYNNTFISNGAASANGGLYIKDPFNVSIHENLFEENFNGFLYEVYDPSYIFGNTTIFQNNFRNNTYALYLKSWLGTLDHHDFTFYNNIVNGTEYLDPSVGSFTTDEDLWFFNVAPQLGERIYTSGSYIGGNYWTNQNKTGWSDLGTDYDYNGFVDLPFELEVGGSSDKIFDYFPLCEGWAPEEPAESLDQTLYFRSDTYTTEGISTYGLDQDFTNDAVTKTSTDSTGTVFRYGFRIYKVSPSASLTELSSYVSGIITVTGNATGYQYGSWNCPETSVNLGWDYLYVRVYISDDGFSWTALEDFVSPYLITEKLLNSQWTFWIYINQTDVGGTVTSEFMFGNYEYKSRITGVGWTTPRQSKVQMWRQSRGDYAGLVIGAYYDLIGAGVYALLTVGFAGSMYSRYQHMGTIVFAYTIMGGSGGLLWFLVPPEGAIIIGAVILLGGSALVWRVIR